MKLAFCFSIIAALLIGSFSGPARAEEAPLHLAQASYPATGYSRVEQIPQADENPPGELIIVDSILLRPLGLVAMGVGFIGSIVAYPWAAASGSQDRVCSELIEKPYKYTFERPVGELDY